MIAGRSKPAASQGDDCAGAAGPAIPASAAAAYALAKARPGYGFLGEEGGKIADEDGGED